ncbi:MATE family efflux transporter [Gammaproteobacteria bacterium]|nr:MATE family efflux transporter [Gammaproteobacteria bacterium]
MQNRTEQFLNDPVFPLLIRMSAPNTIAFFIQAIVVLAEVWFISKLGTTSLAAVALAFPIIMLTQQMAFGALGGAVSSSIARSLGAEDKERAEKLLWHSLLLSCCGYFFFFLIFFTGGESVLMALGGEGSLLEESLLYVKIFLAGGLILGWFGLPKLGIIGAPLSAISVAAFMAIVMIFKFMHSSSNVQLKISNLSFEKELFRDIFNVALPASLAPIFTVGTILILTGLVGQFGVSALAGYGIGSRIEFLMIPLVFGIGTAMTTMVGTNIGANKVERAERIGWLGGSFAGLFSGMIGLILILSSSYWINFFATD